MAASETAEPTRRDFLYIATGAFGAVGAAALIWPFVSQLQPDASVLAMSSTEVDLSQITEGQIVTVKWRGKPVFVWNRTPKDIEEARATQLSALIDPVARNANLLVGHRLDAQAEVGDQSVQLASRARIGLAISDDARL